MKPLTDRYQAAPLGVLSCYDRIIITGTLPGACYAGGMTSFLNSRHFKIFDYAKVFADPWRERIRQCAHELADARGGCNRRYLEFLSPPDDFPDGHRALKQLTEPKVDRGLQVRGFNFFDAAEQSLLLAIQRAEFNIRGLRRADLKKFMPPVSSGKLPRYLKRLRLFGLIKRVGKTYRYYLTHLGRAAVATCEKLTAFTIVQTLAAAR